ncbi:MAG: class I SAM-dependent methyltransferase [Parachlamydiales bacterium]|nr:class I SAM-dependent methyltransferase [Parachlamydiales bacterium]
MFLKTIVLAVCCAAGFSQERWIDSHGIWHMMSAYHLHDESLSDALVEFFHKEKADSVVDLGCGLGDYVKALLASGIPCDGYDGDPDTYFLSNGVAQVCDLTQDLDLGRSYDWVLSLEVGEHIPAEYERVFIENLIKHARKGIVLSWAVKGQDGWGHVNTQDNEYIKNVLFLYGFVNDSDAENALRSHSSLTWFKNTIMVFRPGF